MTDVDSHLPADQRAIRAKCFHPTGSFVWFPAEALDGSLNRRFEEQVRHDAGRLAVTTRRGALTYGELNALANRIAHAIIRHTGAREDPIALLFDHDALAIAAMLGVLKAGKLYVPLDPWYPRQRLEEILRDSTSRLLLTEGRHAAHLCALAGDAVHVLDVESIDAPVTNPDSVTRPDSPAFILYTSGSTGRPKGIIQNHRNVLHDVMHYTNSGHFCADDRFLLVSSLSFADSVRTMYSSLLNGASLFPFDIHAEGLVPLAGWILDQRITIYRSVPTVFRHFVDSLAGDERFADVRLLYLAGEAVRRTDVELYRRHFPPTCAFVNRLGTTETLTFRCYFIDHHTELTGGTVPVGYAVPDHDVHLVDDDDEEVPVGSVGEMAIRSRFLSPGQWGETDPSRTTLADSVDADRRIHRTGDLGRFRSDGCLEHLGRKDFQVKIRGYRVETAEIEAVLMSLGGIREAAVVAERRANNDSLVAYVVPVASPPSPETLRDLLSVQLPDYMVPSSYVVLDALPLLPNGKLNRQGFPAPGSVRPNLNEPFVRPRHHIEAEVAQIWGEVLGLEAVGINDDFLDLGGDSLAATRVVSRVRDRFGLPIPVAMMWKATTVALMAQLIAEHPGLRRTR
jgi:amino acid adenylation domain-containing protein